MSRLKKALILSGILLLLECLLVLSFPLREVVSFNFLFLALAAIPVWLFGMLFPQKVIWWRSQDYRTRKNVSKYAGIQLLVCFALAIIIIPGTEDEALSAAIPSPSPTGKTLSTRAEATTAPIIEPAPETASLFQAAPATQAPASTPKPVATKKPGVSRTKAAPVQTAKPATAKQPASTAKPAASKKPVATKKPVSTAKPKATKKPAAAKAPAQEVYYKNCDAVRAAGAAPIYAGDPGYSRKLDRDGDGVGCEKK